MGEEDAQVLDGGDQIILDLLPPEPSPARPFEVMIVGRISKTSLHELLAASAIAPRRAAVGLRTCYIQERLFFVPVHSAPMEERVHCARKTQARTDSGGCLVFDVWRTGCTRRGLSV